MPKTELTLNSMICRNNQRFLVSKVGEETVMMDTQNGDYIGINPVGTDIWEKIAAPVMVSSLISELVAEYNVEPLQCEKEVVAYLKEMLERNTIEIV